MEDAAGKQEGAAEQTEMAAYVKAKAETEFEKYRVIQDRLYMSDFDKHLLELAGHQEVRYLENFISLRIMLMLYLELQNIREVPVDAVTGR